MSCHCMLIITHVQNVQSSGIARRGIFIRNNMASYHILLVAVPVVLAILYGGLISQKSSKDTGFIRGKVAFVTGGTQGIGLAIAEALLKKGGKVVIAARNSDRGRKVEADLTKSYGKERVLFTECDVTDMKSVEDALKKTNDTFGQIDIIGNNAGILNEREYEYSINVNLLGVIRVTNIAMKYMRKDRGGNGGVIINVASMAGLEPNDDSPVYSASKAGIVGFTRAWGYSQDYDSHLVRVNVLCPDMTDTPFIRTLNLATLRERGVHYPELAADDIEYIKKIDPSTVADAFVQLVEDKSKNGAALMVMIDSEPRYGEFMEY